MRRNQNQFLTSKFSPSHHHNRGRSPQPRPKLKPLYVPKSELVPPPPPSNSVPAEQAAPDDDRFGKLHLRDEIEKPELNSSNVVEQHGVASSSGTKEEDDDNDIMGRLDKLLSKIEEPEELSEEQTTINDQLQQDEVLINFSK